MPFCGECGKKVSKTAKFCQYCGASLTSKSVHSESEQEETIESHSDSSSQIHPEFSLLPHEKIVSFVQPYFLSFFWLYLFGVLFTLTIFGAIFGIPLIILTFLYQRGHKYWITNKRIVLAKTFIYRDIRNVYLKQITDVSVTQGILGRLFEFGTVTPLTASGLGVSGRMSSNKITNVAETETHNSLFGVKNPMKLRDLLMQHMGT